MQSINSTKPIRSYLLPVTLFLLFSCGRLDTLTGRQLVYMAAGSEELRVNLPYGKTEESFKADENGHIEQFCTYDDGSIIYVAYHSYSPTPNAERVKEVTAKSNEPRDNFRGKDGDGYHWKEKHVGDFAVGYSGVPQNRVESFERALNSIRIR